MGLDCVDLGALQDYIGDCHRCALGDTRTTLVFGVGRADADVVLVGEAPGRNEDLNGEPFVGAAGKLLDELLSSIEMARNDAYIANVLKCRPPGNRNPQAHEIETCTPFLREQLRLIDPALVVTMGNFATRLLLGTDDPITRLHGVVHEVDDMTVLPSFHPAAAIYDRSKREVLFADFALIPGLVASRPRLAPSANRAGSSQHV